MSDSLIGKQIPFTREQIIIDNPCASVADIEWLLRRDPLAALRHPNCPPHIWWEGATHLPLDAMKSPAFALMTLAEPDRWVDLEERFMTYWTDHACQRLSKATEMLFAMESAARVLPIFEADYPTETRPRLAMVARQLFAQKKITLDQCQQARRGAEEVARTVADRVHQMKYEVAPIEIVTSNMCLLAVRGALFAVVAEGARDSLMNAREAEGYAAYTRGGDAAAQEAATQKEAAWQWQRVQQIYAEEADL